MADLQNRTLICSVLFIDIVEYSRKSVVEQIELKDRFNALLSDALKGVAVNDRIILDTGDGGAISFIGDPEDALFVATGLRDDIASRGPAGTVELSTRMGINLGPVRLVKDINGQPNIIGDGINVAQRVMSFAKPGQVLVSRSYYEVVSRLSDESSKLFSYEGSRTDKHIREHEVYAVGAIPPLHRRYDDNATPGWVRNGDGTAPGAVSRLRHTAQGMMREVTSKPRLTTLLAVFVILATALGARSWREGPHRNTTLLGQTTTLDESRLSARMPSEAPVLAAPEPEPPMRGMPEAARVAEPAPVVEPPPAPAPQTAPKVAEPAPQRRASAPVRHEAKAPAPVVVLADPKAAQPVEKPLPQAAEAELAVLALAVTPWGQVFVDGKPRGVSPPLQEIELTPGRHRIELRNTAAEPHVITVNAKPGERLRIKHKFN